MYKKKQKQLASPAEAMFFRKSEVEVRPAAVAAARLLVTKILEKVEEWEKTKPHVTETERQDAIDRGNEVLAWLDENEAKQAALECHEDPVFTSTQVRVVGPTAPCVLLYVLSSSYGQRIILLFFVMIPVTFGLTANLNYSV